MELTFDHLCELEPGLQDLHTIARMIKDDGNGKSFCSNFIWYRLLKPRMYDLVGWGRRFAKERAQRESEHFDKENPEMAKMFIKLDIPEPEGIELLDGCEAYSLAYNTIYEQLPNCRDCWCM